MQETLKKLQEFLQQLRSSTGCAWTRKQTLASLAPQTLEECYELIEAIEQGDNDSLRDELSDMLYHIIFYTQIAEEKKLFNLDDLYQTIIDKHLARMPDNTALAEMDAEQINRHWQMKKRQQQQDSVLAGISTALPATYRAVKLQNRAAAVGFDWPSIEPVFNKIDEELNELKDEIKQSENQERILDEYADLLFTCINLGRHLQIDPETALRYANRKFTQRFQYIEQQLAEKNQTFEFSSLEEMEALWQAAKTGMDQT